MLFNWDGYGVLLTNEGSNGDSAHHTAYYYYMKHVMTGVDEVEKLEPFVKIVNGKVEFVRHPTREPGDFSRDQFTPFIASMSQSVSNASTDMFVDIDRYYQRVHLDNNYFFMNKNDVDGTPKKWWDRDLLDPATISLYDRSAHPHDPGVFRYVGDVHLLTSILFRLWKVKDNPSSTADENLILHLMVAKQIKPTWLSNLAAKIYFKYRPDNDGGKGWRGAMIDFWSRNGTYIPGVAYITIKAVEKVFGDECY